MNCTLVARPHPMMGETVYCQVKAGQTVAQMLGDAAYSCSVSIGGYEVPRAIWDKVKPKPGTAINIVLYPQGGRGGKALRLVAIAVISYFTMGAGSGAAAAWLGVSTTTLGVIGAVAILAINSLVPPPNLASGAAGSSDPYDQLQSVTGTSNQATPGGVVPCVIGADRYFPPHAALPYTEISGDQQYLRMLLDLGHGDLDISDYKIGETALDDFDDVEYEIGVTPALFSQDVYELAVGTALNTTGANDIRTTQNPTNEISVDVQCGTGLFGVDAASKTVVGTINVSILYRAVGAIDWLNPKDADGLTFSSSAISNVGNDFPLKGGARKLLRAGIRWKVPTGQYEVRVGRDTTSWAGTTVQTLDEMTWTVLRSISHQVPSTTGTTKLALRIKATGQLNGVVSNLSVLAAQKVRTWDVATQTFGAAVSTQNPAWIYLWLMTQCAATVRRVADSRMDLDGIAEWAADCAVKGYRVAFVADSPRQFGDLLKDVMACGRGARGMRNGKYSVVRDVEQASEVQLFTPANSWGFSYSRNFIEPPHALRVKFRNPNANYQEDVRVVYWDGYDSANATRFEDLDLRIVDDPDAAWKLGRYHLSVMWLRPNQYELNADIEHMVCEPGDRIKAAHNITGWGVAWGRVRAISGTSVTLVSPVTLEAGKTYKLRIRSEENTQDEQVVTTPAGTYAVLDTGVALDGAVGDLYVLGELASPVADLLVRRIEPSGDEDAKLTCVDYVPDVLTADAGMPPAFVSTITGKPWCAPPDAPVVHIRTGDSAPDDAGIVYANPGVSSPPSSGIHRIRIRDIKYPLEAA